MEQEFEDLDAFYTEHYGASFENAGDEVRDASDLYVDGPVENEDSDLHPVSPSDAARNYIENETETITDEAEQECDRTDDLSNLGSVLRKGCGCTSGCFRMFSFEEIYEEILKLREIEKSEKEMLIMGTLKEIAVDGSRQGNERKRKRYCYSFKGLTVCRHAFEVLFDVKERQLDNILQHMKKNGNVPRQHGLKGKRSNNAFSFEEVKNAVTFLINYANEFGLPQPAAPRGTANTPPVLLPASFTKRDIFKQYQNSCTESNSLKSLGKSSFHDVWLKCVPHIKISNPKEDVCKTCEDHRLEIQGARTDGEKMTAATRFQEHIADAMTEKQTYRLWIEKSLSEMESENGPRINTHYTMDFANPITIPHRSRQVGPIYFEHPIKVQLFGVRIGGGKQHNFIINENETIGPDGTLTHGPNAVISMLHHILENYSFDEEEFGIHADNCGGQNKNRYVLAYFCWRILTGRNRKITYMFQIPGHTRCLIDAGFGNIKRLYRRSDCDTIQHISNIVNKSSLNNNAILYRGSGLQWRDWKQFLAEPFRPLKGIRKYHHFQININNPGVVMAKKRSSDEEGELFRLLKDQRTQFDPGRLPSIIQPAGFSDARKGYLQRSIRPLMRPEFRDFDLSTSVEE